MKQKSNTLPALSPYNQAVKTAYFGLLKYTDQLLANLEDENLRGTFQRESKFVIETCTTYHEMISPALYLSLQCNDGVNLSIQYGFENLTAEDLLKTITSFVRAVFSFTDKNNTEVNIEDCIDMEFVIIDCCGLYDTIEARPRLHTFKQIPYKPIRQKGKHLRSVA